MIRQLYFTITLLLVATHQAAGQCDPESTGSKVLGCEERTISTGELSGKYLDAGEGAPVVLIVPGSGPTDLDGNNSFGMKSNVYKQMASALALKGISTVRVDKRGMFSSKGAGDPNAVSVEVYAQDYRDWVETLRSETGAPCVHLLGHSEGALMVSAAAIDNDGVCGLILVSGVGRPFGDVLREQLKANPANKRILKRAFAAIKSLEQGIKVDDSNMHEALRSLFDARVQDFLISMMAVDPAEIAAKANKDTLIIHGTNDLQTSVIDAQRLADATEGYLVLVDGVNHVLKKAPRNRRRNIATYNQPNLPISESVVAAISIFVLQ